MPPRRSAEVSIAQRNGDSRAQRQSAAAPRTHYARSGADDVLAENEEMDP